MDNYLRYQQLRKQYSCFTYTNYHLSVDNDQLNISYDFQIDNLATFHPSWSIPLMNRSINLNDPLLHRYCFTLGLVELVSYWKISCPPLVKVNCGSLEYEQIQWFKKLYYHGLGEFFYINGIEENMDTFMRIQPLSMVSEPIDTSIETNGQLIPFGGGKDSYVSATLLKDVLPNYAYVINDVKSAVKAVNVAGYSDRFIHVKRTLDKTMLDLNKSDQYLNGHTPFSAIVAFSSVLVSYIYGIKNICLSNESSANESTIANATINHQYSKTFEFEQDFNWYNATYLCDKIHYFSFLRPLNELQISALFTLNKAYLSEFRSCNVGSKEGKWCGHCAKCCFVAMMMAPFLDDATINSIFNTDIFNDASLIPLFDQLIGKVEDKPFECVGTRIEVQAACIMAIKKREGKPLPLILNRYIDLMANQTIVDEVIHQKNNQHLVPDDLYSVLECAMKGVSLW